MKKILFSILLFCVVTAFVNEIKAQDQKIVVLKLDDVTDDISPRWQRVSDFLEQNQIKAGFGVIGYSLVNDNPDYFKWIKERAERGCIEFWNHGFYNRTQADTVGEFEGSYESQLRALQLTDSLAIAKLGLTFSVWGPHWSKTNEDTDRALTKVKNIRLTFGYPEIATHYNGAVFPLSIDMEYPEHNPDFEEFLKAYKREAGLRYFYLQGHPNSWDDNRWNNFVKIVRFLQSENVRFFTPSEFSEFIEKKWKSISFGE